MNNTVLNKRVHIFVWTCIFILGGYVLEVELLGHMVSECSNVFQNNYYLAFHLWMYEHYLSQCTFNLHCFKPKELSSFSFITISISFSSNGYCLLPFLLSFFSPFLFISLSPLSSPSGFPLYMLRRLILCLWVQFFSVGYFSFGYFWYVLWRRI